MNENSTALKRLLNAARPYKAFSLTIDGRVFDGFVRKASLAEAQEISATWDKNYNDTIALYNSEGRPADQGLTIIFENLKRQKKHTLARFIVTAEEGDLAIEADTLLGGDADRQTQTFKDQFESLKETREKELLEFKEEDLLQLAMDRRVHFYAVEQANNAVTRKMAQLTIFDEDKNPFFNSEEEVKELPSGILDQLMDAATKAIAEDTAGLNPLVSQRRTRSVKHSSSQKSSEEE